MTRPYAQELYGQKLSDDACPVCGFPYVKELPEDQRHHRSFHACFLSVFEPKPNKALSTLHARFGHYVPLTAQSPTWLNRRLYRIARALRWENNYDYPMWSESGCDAPGFILTDSDGRALGGCAVEWGEWSDVRARYVLQWIWIAPPYRRQGLLRDTWSMLTAKYDGILPAPPYSPEAARFFLSLGNLSAHVESAARFALQEAGATARGRPISPGGVEAAGAWP